LLNSNIYGVITLLFIMCLCTMRSCR